MKIVVNRCFGGFSLSSKLMKEYRKITGVSEDVVDFELDRDDEVLVSLVEKYGDEANGYGAKVKIFVVPDDATDWMLDDYDGIENILYVQDGKIYRAIQGA